VQREISRYVQVTVQCVVDHCTESRRGALRGASQVAGTGFEPVTSGL